MGNTQAVERWTAAAAEKLVGRRITAVRYLTDEEQQQLGWCSRTLVIVLDDGNSLWASADDEGNEAGALFTTFDTLATIPVIF